ncbi:MAG: hypothetical protein ACOX6S_05855 [Clostridia bacterium]|jgi:hypothetical protein
MTQDLAVKGIPSVSYTPDGTIKKVIGIFYMMNIACYTGIGKILPTAAAESKNSRKGVDVG